MALIIEDGTGVSGAEAWADAAAYDAWLVSFFDETSLASVSTKEAAIRRAVAFMNGLEWVSTATAGLSWPRDGYDDIPAAIVFAQHVYTRAELASPGSLSPSVTLQGEKVLNKVGEIGWEVVSAPNTPDAKRPIVTMALDALKGLLLTNDGRSSAVKCLLRA